jgi:UDP-N-acetyl-D-galactosamine dehydrogenase
MAGYVARKIIQHIIRWNGDVKTSRVLIKGATFKENVSDIRNSKVADMVKELQSFYVNVEVEDPFADSDQLNHEYGFGLTKQLSNDYDVVVIAVPHEPYLCLDDNYFAGITKAHGLIADLKGLYRNKINKRNYWSL